MILLLIFCLLRRIQLDPHVVDFLRILHTFFVTTTKTYTVPLDPHIVYVFNNYNTFAVLTTDKPRLLTAVVFFYRIFSKQYGQPLRLHDQLTHREVRFIEYFTTTILFISSFIARPSRCWLLMYFTHILRWNNQNLHRTAWTSHCIFFTINKTLVNITTHKPRLFMVFFSITYFQQYGRMLRLHHQPKHR